MTASELASTIQAKHSGKGYITCCPVHDDTKPSLYFYDNEYNGSKYIHFKCYTGCSHKDIQEHYRATGVLTTRPIEHTRLVLHKKKHTDYTELYQYFLALLDDTEAIEYMKRRGISKRITTGQGIKNIPVDTRAIQRALQDTYDIDTLLDSGLYAMSKNNKPYLSLFAHRLVIPYTYKSRIATLQGRVINPIELNAEYAPPKYKLLPGRPVIPYDQIAIDTAKNTHKKLCICEGVFDALSIYELNLIQEYGYPVGIAGISNYTTLLQLLDGLQITLATDQDRAGTDFVHKFSREYMKLYKSELYYLPLPNGIKDLNEYLQQINKQTTT